MKFLTLALTCIPLMASALSFEGAPIVMGPNCDSENTPVTLAEDASSFSIIYGDMSTSSEGTELDDSGMKRAPVKNCKVRINLRSKPGFQVELQQVDYRGFMKSPTAKSYAWFQSLHQFVGGSVLSSMGRTPSSRMIGSIGIVKSSLPAEGQDVFWAARFMGTEKSPQLGKHISDCKGVVALEIDASVRGHSFDGSDVTVMLDTADAEFKQLYRLSEVPCDAWNKNRERLCKRGTCN